MIDGTYIRVRRGNSVVELRAPADSWPRVMDLASKHFTDGRDIGGPVVVEAESVTVVTKAKRKK